MHAFVNTAAGYDKQETQFNQNRGAVIVIYIYIFKNTVNVGSVEPLSYICIQHIKNRKVNGIY